MEPSSKFPGEPLYKAIQNWFRARTRQELIAMGAGFVAATFGTAIIVSKYRERRRRKMLEDQVTWSSRVTITPSTSMDFESKSTGTRPSESYDSMRSEGKEPKDLVKPPEVEPEKPAVPLPPMPPPPPEVPPEPIPPAPRPAPPAPVAPPPRAVPPPRAPPPPPAEIKPTETKVPLPVGAATVPQKKGTDSATTSTQFVLPKESSPHVNVLQPSSLTKPAVVMATGTATKSAILPPEKKAEEKKEKVHVDRGSIVMPVKPAAAPDRAKRKTTSKMAAPSGSKEGLKTAKPQTLDRTSSKDDMMKGKLGKGFPSKHGSKHRPPSTDKKSRSSQHNKKGSKMK